jgi:hypothetical protein
MPIAQEQLFQHCCSTAQQEAGLAGTLHAARSRLPRDGDNAVNPPCAVFRLFDRAFTVQVGAARSANSSRAAFRNISEVQSDPITGRRKGAKL